MNGSNFPAGWDEQRVKRLIQHYETLTDDEQVAEDEAALSENPEQTVVTVPTGLLPVIRQLLAEYERK